jgi:type IV pilus assembly protein PilC
MAAYPHVATRYEEELDAQLETLTSIIEPVLIVVIGGVIGAIVIALYLPLCDLITVVE